MSHCDAESLALRALGEQLGGPDEAHLPHCPACQRELSQLQRVVGAARAITVRDRLVSPPRPVWERIVMELRLDDEVAANGAQLQPTAVRELPTPRRRPGRLLPVAAVLLGLLVGASVTALLVGRPSGGTVLAATRLAPLPDHSGGGEAVLSRRSGSEVLTVDVTGLATDPSTFYEVWLLAPDASRLVALGMLGPSERGTFVLPPGLDVHAYPVVDVSAEPRDGNPAHSSDSVVRGTLPV